jgi:hypothetical protein
MNYRIRQNLSIAWHVQSLNGRTVLNVVFQFEIFFLEFSNPKRSMHSDVVYISDLARRKNY